LSHIFAIIFTKNSEDHRVKAISVHVISVDEWHF
jgi:hypothetical protein